jgi:hypothetical protein
MMGLRLAERSEVIQMRERMCCWIVAELQGRSHATRHLLMQELTSTSASTTHLQ